ncbi:hypothetical protein JS55_02050 [Rickettsia felis str. LSU]|nr:hypothetical protein JS55_02050 [Rickettsia felis str. LSU]KHO03913.1 hypothetical protein JS61_01990 [Rickettsia felis]
MNTLRLVLESNTILTNISFNSDTNVIIETGKSLNIAGLLTIGSGSTLNISGEGTLTLGSNIVSKNIIENINYKGITPEILLNNTIALNLNFTEENIYNNSDTIILGNIDSEI